MSNTKNTSNIKEVGKESSEDAEDDGDDGEFDGSDCQIIHEEEREETDCDAAADGLENVTKNDEDRDECHFGTN